MVKVQMLTRHGNNIGIEVEDLDEARKLLSNQFVVVNGQDRFTAIAVSSIDLLDAVETWIASMKSDELNI
jgi:hypothetical protein